MKSKYLIKTMLTILVISLFITLNHANSQIILKGKVIDSESKNPIKDVEVVILNWDTGTKTDNYGNYKITLPESKLIDGYKIKLQFYANNYGFKYPSYYYYKKKPPIFNTTLEKAGSKSQSSTPIVKIYKINYREPSKIYQIILPYLNHHDWAKATVSSDFKTITVKDREEVHEKIEWVIQEYDIPLKKIWLKITIIRASENGKAKRNVPEEIEKVVKKLSSLFKFDKYEIVSWGDAMGLEESTLNFTSAIVSDPTVGGFNAHAKLSYFEIEDIIKLERFNVSMPLGNQLQTTINIRNGETVVVGASRGNPKHGSLITVVTAKVIE